MRCLMADRSHPETRAAVERRRTERAPVVVQIEYSTVDALFSDFTRNINEGGIFVETDEPIPLDQKVDLKLQLPGSKELVHVMGRVVRVESTSPTSVGGIAIEFGELDANARELINAAVRRLRSDSR